MTWIRKRRSWLATRWYRLAMGIVLISWSVGAEDRVFVLGGATITLSEATALVDVYFQSLRFNRSLSVWNVELTVSNKSATTLEGPLVLLVENFTGTSGPLSPDGSDGGLPAKSFYELSGYVGGSTLLPGQKTSPRTLTLGFTGGAPNLGTKFYVKPAAASVARAFTRSLNDAGQPLPDVQVEETGTQGANTNSTDSRFGIATLGQGTGAHAWKFSAPGFLPVWRQLTLTTGAVANLPNPRLTPRSESVFNLSAIAGGAISNREGTVQITFPPGSFAPNTTGRVTSLTGQTLPGFLPPGWSPLQAFWVELSNEPTAPGRVNLTPWGALNNGESAVFTRWNPATLAWDVLAIGGTTDVPLPGSGAFALVVGDLGPLAPPAPTPGTALPPSLAAPPNLSSLVATGAVQPSVSSASLIPELVTAHAQVIVSNQTGNLPSGLLLRCEITDHYQLTDGSRRRVPQYENFVVGYQRPGDNSLATVHADFPLRPVLLLEGDELDVATIKVDVMTNGPFAGGILDPNGGQVATEDIRVLAGLGDLLSSQAVPLRKLDPTNFSEFNANGLQVLRAFDLAVTSVASNHHLRVRFGPMPTNSFFVLAKVISDPGVFGLEPRERLVSNSSGNLDSEDPVDDGDHLPGIVGAGEYLLLKVPSRQGLVRGIARNAQGQPAAGLLARAPPWLTFSAGDGSYRLLAPTGNVTVAVTDLATGDTGSANTNVTNPLLATILDPSAAENAPSVLAVFPAAGATAVPRVTPVSVTFSKRINPATMIGNTIQLLGLSNQPVAATLSLNLKNTVATLLPTDPLAPNTLHTVLLSTNIADLSGRKLSGPNQFAFTTETDALNRPLGAQVISHEPTNGVARMEGTQGIADPNAPVILVNETSGRTATVLASADGSFTNHIAAEVDDFLSAVLVNQNGTRTTIPVSRQIYRDGRIGLFAAGGELTAEGGEGFVAITIPPGAIAGKSVFRLQSLIVSNVLAQFGGVRPSNSVMAASMRLELAGDQPIPPMQLRFDFSPTNLPPGRELSNLVAIAAVPQVIDGVTAYQFVGQARLTNGLASRPGMAARAGDLTGLVSFGGLGGGAASGAFSAMSMLIMDPDLYAPASIVGVAGPVSAAEVTAPNLVVPGTEVPLSGAVVTISDLADFKSRPARFFPGEVYAVTDEVGHYSMIAPQVVFGSFGEGFAAVATHPRFPRSFAASPAIRVAAGKSTIRAAIIFEQLENPPDVYPPSITASHIPRRPVPGGTAILNVTASDDGLPLPVTIDPAEVSVAGVNVDPLTDVHIHQAADHWEITCDKLAKVTLVLRATDVAGNERAVPYAIHFGGTEPLDPNPTFTPNPNDLVGPFVVATRPAAAPGGAAVSGTTGLLPGTPLVIRFSEPIDAGIESAPKDSLSLLPDNAGAPAVELVENQRELIVHYPQLQPNTEYELTLQNVVDVSGQTFDQDPTPEAVVTSFTFKFKTAPVEITALPSSSIQNGGGVVMRGKYLYMLDRSGPNDGALLVFDLSTPTAPPINALNLPGYPRDLVILPQYSFKRSPRADPETKDLIAVVGGPNARDLMAQYLYLVDISKPEDPDWNLNSVVATALISPDPTAVAPRVAWNAPNLAIVENKANYSSIQLVEVQRFIYGRHLTPADYPSLPLADEEGVDLNSDGDYVDAGEILPLPSYLSVLGTVGYPGRLDTFTLDRYGRQIGDTFLGSSTRFIHDVGLASHGELVGAVISSGVDIVQTSGGLQTNQVPASYRSYLRGQDVDGDLTKVEFPDYNPKRVLITEDIPWPDFLTGNLLSRTLAFIVMVRDDAQLSKLVVLDVSVDSATGLPRREKLQEFQYPPTGVDPTGALVDLLQGIARADDGRIILSTTTNFLIVEPSLLPLPTPLNAIHPAVVGTITDASAGATTFAVSGSGIAASSLRGRNRISYFGPRLQLVNGPLTGDYDVLDLPRELTGNGDQLDEVGLLREPLLLTLASNQPPSNLDPLPDWFAHHYVLVQAPGWRAAALPPTLLPGLLLTVESLDHLGQPLARDPSLYPPAQVDGFPAFRLSNDPTRPEYNLFLSQPLALLTDELDQATHDDLIENPINRALLAAGNSVRASLSSAMSGDPVLGPFATAPGTIPGSPPVLFNRPGSARISFTGLPPGFSAPTNGTHFTVKTSVDRSQIPAQICPGAVRITFELTHEAFVSFKISPTVGGVGDFAKDVLNVESDVRVPVFEHIPYSAGRHTIEVDALSVGIPGEHGWELIASHLPHHAGYVTSVKGVLDHDVELNNTYPIGHTVISGVDIHDGHLTHSRQDVLIPGRRLSLEFTRSYGSSGDSAEGPLGAGWTHNYNCRVIRKPCGVWTLIGGEGSGNSFSLGYAASDQATLRARYLPLLDDRTGPRYSDRTFLKPQLGYHSAMVLYDQAPDEIDFFTKSGVRYSFKLEPFHEQANVFTLREIREPNHNRLVFDYHPNGDGQPATLDQVREVDRDGDTKRALLFEYVYDGRFNTRRITRLTGKDFVGGGDLFGLEINYRYDEFGNLTNVVRQGSGAGYNDQRSETYTYTSGDTMLGHNLRSYTDPNGSRTTYDYRSYTPPPPANYYANFSTPPTPPAPIPGVPDCEIIKSVTRETGVAAEDVVIRFDYNFLTRTRTVYSPRETEGVPVTIYTLNDYGATTQIDAPLGQVTRMRWATDLPLPPGRSVDQFTGSDVPDVLMIEKTDAEGRAHEYYYGDGRGNLTKEVVKFAPTKPVKKHGATVLSTTTTYAYDPLFNQRTNMVDAESNPTTYTIHPVTGNLEAVEDVLGQRTEYDYANNGDLEVRRDPRMIPTIYANYDAYGNAQKVTDGEGNVTDMTYDERSRLRTSSGAFLKDLVFGYDDLDRKVSETKNNLVSSSGPGQTIEYRYLPNGELVTVKNGLNHFTHHSYDNLNRKILTVETNVTQAAGAPVSYVTRYAYDRDSNLVREEDPRHIIRTNAFDHLNRRVATGVLGPSTPVGLTVFTGQYDLVGNLTAESDLHGNTNAFEYDGLYRVVTRTLPFESRTLRTGYDLVGNKLSETDANGQTTLMNYDPVYRLKHLTNAVGVVTEYSYDLAGNKTREQVLTANGLDTEYTNFDGLNRAGLLRRKVPLGDAGLSPATYETEYTYLDTAHTVTVKNPRGFFTVTAKDSLDRVHTVTVNSTAAAGAPALTTTYTYDANGNPVTVTDAEGSAPDVTHEYDGLNRRIRSTFVPAPNTNGVLQTDTETFLYDGNGNVVEFTDKRGVKFTSTYDNLNRLLEKHVVESLNNGSTALRLLANAYDDPANTLTVTDANGNPPTVTYFDELNRPKQFKDALGQDTIFEYDGVNKRAEMDRNHQRTEFDYDGINRLIASREKDVGGTVRTTSAVAYDDNLNRRTETDRNGYHTIYQMDGLGRLVQTFRSEAGGPASLHPLAVRYGAAELLMEAREYDGNGNNTLIVDGNANRTRFTYDGADRRLQMIEGDTSVVIATTTYTYDKANNVLTVKDGRGGWGFDQRHTYDARYRKATTENGEGEISRFRYDENNNLAYAEEPQSAAHVTKYVYDELGKLIHVDESARGGGFTAFLYDANRNRLAQQDASGNLVTYQYDSLNRLTNTHQHTALGTLPAKPVRSTAISHAPSLSWQFGYDGNGNQTLIRDPRGQEVMVGFDWLDRPVTRTYAAHVEKTAGNPLRFQPLAFTNVYDGNGNLLAAIEAKADGVGGTLTERTDLEYDPLNRPARRTRTDFDAAMKAITFEYDIQGNRTRVTDPDGFATAYAFDARNRLRTVTAEAGTAAPKVTTYSWWEDSLLRRVDFANGAYADRSGAGAYDQADRAMLIENHAAGGALLSRYAYLYDNNGNRTQQTEVQSAFGAPEVTAYTYDTLNRLQTVAYGAAGNLTYTYGLNGNRLTETGTDPVSALPVSRTFIYTSTGPKTYTGVNTLARIQDNLVPANTVDYEYDENLNQSARIQGAVRRDFRFDIRDQIAETTQAGNTTAFDYNADRLRVKKVDPVTGETRYLYDQSAVLVEYRGAADAHATLHKYDYGYALLSLTTPSPTRFRDYYMQDGLRSTANLTDDAGVLKQSYRYDAWGRVRQQAGPSDNPRQYTGHYKDTETGLHYFGARYYDEEQGRFLSQDPYLGEANTPPSLHRYLYAYANPLRYVDLLGYDPTDPNASNSTEQPGPTIEAWNRMEAERAKSRVAGASKKPEPAVVRENPGKPAVDPDTLGNIDVPETIAEIVGRGGELAERRFSTQGETAQTSSQKANKQLAKAERQLERGPKKPGRRLGRQIAKLEEAVAESQAAKGAAEDALQKAKSGVKAGKRIGLAGTAVATVLTMTDNSPAVSGELPNQLLDPHAADDIIKGTAYLAELAAYQLGLKATEPKNYFKRTFPGDDAVEPPGTDSGTVASTAPKPPAFVVPAFGKPDKAWLQVDWSGPNPNDATHYYHLFDNQEASYSSTRSGWSQTLTSDSTVDRASLKAEPRLTLEQPAASPGLFSSPTIAPLSPGARPIK